MMSPLKFLISLMVITLLLIGGIVLYVKIVSSGGLPSLSQLENPRQNLATQVFSADGELLDHFFFERRIALPFDSIPPNFINALIAIEDKTFWSHWGVHTTRIFNAAVKNLMAQRVKEGASTITMQLARNLFLNRENTLDRKIREALTAMQIEKTYTKKEILEMYSNTVNFGRGAYGLQIASHVYFDKPASELTLSECAFLAALLKAPEHYNGINDQEKALQRRNLVLSLMRDQKLIDDGQFIMALEEPIDIFGRDPSEKKRERRTFQRQLAPHFVEMIRQKLTKTNNLQEYDLYRDGLTIRTTINSRIQKYANEAVEEHLKEFQTLFNKAWNWNANQKLLNQLLQRAIRNRQEWKVANDAKKLQVETSLRSNSDFVDSVKNAATTVQAGCIVIDPASGAVLAMVGASPKFMRENPEARYSLNHAAQIKRQPGSAFKPFVYALAIQNGMTPEDMIECGPFTYRLTTGEVWSPRGTGGCDESGMVTLNTALRRSINTVAARLVTTATSPREVVDLVRRMGIESRLHAVPAISLGAGGEVSPYEMTTAYCAFANNGVHIEPYYISRIEDKNGNVFSERQRYPIVSDALRKDIANRLTYMMQGVIDGGTGWQVRNYFKGVEAAGKTGTTNDAADAWFIGYTPQLVAGIWVGFDDRRITFDCVGAEGYGGRAAAPVWGRLMAKIYSDPALPFKQTRFSFSHRDSSDAGVKEFVPREPAAQDTGNQAVNTAPRRQPARELSTANGNARRQNNPNRAGTVPQAEAQPQKKAVLPKLPLNHNQ